LEATCQRCHEPLREADHYCSVCGLPQLVYLETEGPPPLPFGPNDGSVVPVGLPEFSATGIAWRPALRACVLLSIPAGFLFFELFPISLFLSPLLMGVAAAWAVALYGKRARLTQITMGAGARIGLITGIFASWLVLTVNGFALWSARFLQHQGSQMDAEFITGVNTGLQRQQQMAAEMGMTGAQAAESAQFLQTLRVWMLSPEGRAGAILSGLLVCAALLVFFSTIGGAVGARFLGRSLAGRPRPAA
jgi:hypothetical protein